MTPSPRHPIQAAPIAVPGTGSAPALPPGAPARLIDRALAAWSARGYTEPHAAGPRSRRRHPAGSDA